MVIGVMDPAQRFARMNIVENPFVLLEVQSAFFVCSMYIPCFDHSNTSQGALSW